MLLFYYIASAFHYSKWMNALRTLFNSTVFEQSLLPICNTVISKRLKSKMFCNTSTCLFYGTQLKKWENIFLLGKKYSST